MGRRLSVREMAERSRRLMRVVQEARRFATATVAGDRPGVRVARERLLAAVAALDRGPGSARRAKVAPRR
jgi:hypothetical protein